MERLIFFGLCSFCLRFQGTFRNVQLTVHPEKAEPYNATVNGNIQPRMFNRVIVNEIYAREQNITHLRKGTIENMKSLQKVGFYSSNTQIIDTGAFINLPNLTYLAISDGNVARIRKDVFNTLQSLQHLHLESNTISTIDDGAFGDMLSLKGLYLRNNKMEEWRPEWLPGTTSLEIIDLENNSLNEIPVQAFSQLPGLKELNFNYNDIHIIHLKAFEGLNDLNLLGLKYNKITFLEPQSFPAGLNLKTFLIDANNLNYLPNHILEQLTIKEISIEGNPWKCDCLNSTISWAQHNHVTMISRCFPKDKIPCVQVEDGDCIETVDSYVTEQFLEMVKPLKLDKNCIRFN